MLINVSHSNRVVFPIVAVILYYIQEVNPKVSLAQPLHDVDGISESLWKPEIFDAIQSTLEI